MVSLWPSGLGNYFICKRFAVQTPNVVNEICDPNKSRAQHCRKMILQNILQNFAIYLFKYFVLDIMIISGNDTILYYMTNPISLFCIILWNAVLTPE